MDKNIIVLIIVTLTALYGLSLVISGSHFHLKITSAEEIIHTPCYHASNPSPNVENFCLHFNVWKTSALLGVVFGTCHLIFGLATVIVTYMYQIVERSPWERKRLAVAEDFIATDCQIIWLGYHLLTMLLFSYIFHVLLSTKAHTDLDVGEIQGMKSAGITFISIIAVEFICRENKMTDCEIP
ncbi:unnamed protein product, partial [Allacma fusca]